MSVFSIGSAATGAWLVQVIATDARVSRSMAAEAVANNLQARMRANEAGVSAGSYVTSSNTPACLRRCDAVAVAGDDMRRFHDAVASQLGPRARGEVHCLGNGRCEIRIDWDGRETLAWGFAP
jgi:hypothetical protein